MNKHGKELLLTAGIKHKVNAEVNIGDKKRSVSKVNLLDGDCEEKDMHSQGLQNPLSSIYVEAEAGDSGWRQKPHQSPCAAVLVLRYKMTHGKTSQPLHRLRDMDNYRVEG